MKKLIIYIHGKGGNAEESKHFDKLFPDGDVIGFDYKSATPWDAQNEFSKFFDSVSKEYDDVEIIANSIGAFLAMNSLSNKRIAKAYFISPVVDMEKLIAKMMMWANVTEQELELKKEIPTAMGETLSWKYLCFVKAHPLVWNIPTHILYGEHDNLTSIDTISEFSAKINATLTILKGGEHWFHTAKQMLFLDNWIRSFN